MLPIQESPSIGENDTARAILGLKDPFAVKQKMSSFNNRDDADFMKTCEQMLFEVMTEKYNQNEAAGIALLKTGNSKLVETTTDLYWGGGWRFERTADYLRGGWPGDNRTGQLLEVVRTNLRRRA